MKTFLTILGILSLAYFYFYLVDPTEVINESLTLQTRKERKAYNNALRWKQEFLMLRDPVTNKIPDNIYYLEQKFVQTLPKRTQYILHKGKPILNIESLTWTERGPNNISGRVRALGIDIRTTGIPTLIAGGVSGGIWKSTDGGNYWVKKTTADQIHSVTCIAQDTRTGSRDTWYYGTGENIGNSASAEGGTYFGNGVFKSTNNGESWFQLASTNVVDNTTFNSDWQYVFNIVVHPTSGSVYAATTGGIYRSTNGGTDWTKILDPSNNNTLTTDVTIAADGTVYTATSSNGEAIAGIRKSTNDGDSWTNVSPTLPDNFGRTLIKTAPSNSSVVYFFNEGVSGNNSTPNVHNHQLWRSTDAGVSWSNISTVIPANTAPNLDNFSTQDGFDMLLSVKPDDDKFIIVGGVSIFKIHDVTNDTQTLDQKHIGGYGIAEYGTSNDLGDYINHHPDSHTGVFKPGSNIIYYTGNDGGVAYTNDITAAAGDSFWETPLRSTFNIAQFYHASLDKTAGSGFIAGGLQDRGNWMSRENGSLKNWQEVGGGDGGFTEIDPSGTNVFMSTTEGNIFRFLKSDYSSPVTSTTNIKPGTLTNALFINPFDVDDNDGDIIYFSGGNTENSTTSGIWRTTNSTSPTPTWEHFTNSNVSEEQVSAITVSKASSANVLYYGTSGGEVYRIDNANTAPSGTTTPTNITDDSFPAGYVSSIAVDPANSENVFVTFSNYNVNRLWYSSNSGDTWTNVTGNLSGAVSVRWVKMFSISGTPHYFLGTSIGVFFTINLNGASTVWTQEAVTSVGNVVVTTIDYRESDNTIIAATHGRGVFESVISTPLPVELNSFSAKLKNNLMILKWITNTEMNNYGFEVQRIIFNGSSIQNDSWEKIGFVKGHGISNSPKEYYFEEKISKSGKYLYRLKQIDNDGQYKYSDVVEVLVDNLELVLPKEFSLSQNYPNPFNPSTTISYSIPKTSKVKVSVYNSNGEVVKTLVDEFKEAGNYQVTFNAFGLASGVYFYQLQAGKFNSAKKMLLTK